jgi:plasmid replication initiation protein
MRLEEQIAFDFEASRVSTDFVVTKANVLIELPHNLEVQEYRLIHTLISLIQPGDEQFKTHFLRVKEVADLLEIQEKNFYKKIREVVTSLQKKQLTIREGNESDLVVNWLSASRYHHKKGLVELEFSPQLRPYLLTLKRDFTSYRLVNTLFLKSKYSIRIYEILKRYQNFGGRKKFTLEDLRGLLEIERDKLTHYGHLKQRVLLRSQSELAEKTDICFEFEEIKTLNRVVSIVFNIKSNTRRKVLTDGAVTRILDEGAYDLLTRFGVRKDKAKELIQTFGEERVKANIQYVYDKKKDANVENISGYIVKAIQDNYVDSLAEYDEENDLDFETSILQLNQRIQRHISFAQAFIVEDPNNERSIKSEMAQKIMNDINAAMSARSQNRLRPLEEADLDHQYAKEIFAYVKENPHQIV